MNRADDFETNFFASVAHLDEFTSDKSFAGFRPLQL